MGLLIPCIFLLVLSGSVFAAPELNGTLGRSVYFQESISNPALLLTWNFKGNAVATRVPGFAPGCVSQYAGRCELYDNGTLRLDNLIPADEGTYTFTAQEPPSTLVKETAYELRVYSVLSVPVLSINVTDDRPINGTSVSLHCNASSQTVTTYTFYHNGNNVCSNPHVTCRDSYLYFQPITESDSGSYTCTIQNPVSTNTSNTLQLSVSVRVSDVKITSNISGLVWPGLDSPSLTCSARGTNVSYSWSLQGAPLPQDPHYHLTDNNTVLTISPVSDKDNESFTCTATNWINNETSNGVTFNLASAVSAVAMTSNTSGSYIWAGKDSVSFHCSADGSVVTFQWKLNGASLPPDSRYHITQGSSPPRSNLTISPVSRNDVGPFTCEASNRLGNKTSDALSLNLAWIPEGTINCTAVPVGPNVELGCSWVGGRPAANVSLIFGGKTDNGTNNVTRVVTTGDNFQGSELTCLGDQLGRTSHCTVAFVRPEAPEHNNNTITTPNVGDTVVLTVNLVPGLPAEFTWYRLNPDPVPIPTNRKAIVESTSSSSSLRIPNVSMEDAGKYECRAKNIIGTQSFLFNVNVTETPVKNGGLSGGAIAGIAIGVLAGVALTGVGGFFIWKKKKHSGDNKRINEPEDQLGSPQYSTVQKQNGGTAETSLTNNQQDNKDDVNYAMIRFSNSSAKATATPPPETEYSTVKMSTKK